MQISMLRKLLGSDKIATLSGRGYRFTLPVTCCAYPEDQSAVFSSMKIMMLDDHLPTRETMCSVIRELVTDAIVMEASTASDARHILKQIPGINLMILDPWSSELGGLLFLRELRLNYPRLGIVVISDSQEQGRVIDAINLGSLGFIPKARSRQTILDALKQILSGGIYLPGESQDSPLQAAGF